MADNFDLKIGLEGEKEFKKVLPEINRFRTKQKNHLITVKAPRWFFYA